MDKIIKKASAYTKLKVPGSVEFLSSVQEYTTEGNLLFNKEFDQDGNLDSVIEMDYDENDLLKKEATIHVKDGFEERKSYEYDENAKLISQRIDYHGGAWSIKKYKRNNQEKSLEIITLDEENQLEEKEILMFDDKNRLISRAEYDEKEKLKEKTISIYDDQNDLIIRKEEYNKKNKIEKVHLYFYNKEKKLEGIKTENRKGKLLDWVKLEYDDKGSVIMQKSMSGVALVLEHDYDKRITVEKQHDNSGALVNEIISEKDEYGNVIKEKSVDKEVRYLYEYW